MSELSVANTWSCACYLIRLHGMDAVPVALEQMREKTLAGDYRGEEAWYAIAMATSDLQRVRFIGEAVH
jgi:hypothetical protein